jgi:hypothetical protein
MNEWWHTTVDGLLQEILLLGAAMTAIWIGVKRVYSVARSVEKILEFSIDQQRKHDQIAKELEAHVVMEESRDLRRDQQIAELVSTVREIGREVRPNGGSSMKDVLNHTAERVGDIHSRVSVLEEWKRSEIAIHDR